MLGLRERLRLAVLLLLPLCTNSALGLTCISPTIEIFPAPGQIPPNPVFVIQGMGTAGEQVREIGEADLELRGAEAHWPARILERSSGYVSYVVVAPAVSRLPAGPVSLRWLQPNAGQAPRWVPLGAFEVQASLDETFPAIVQQEHRAAVRLQSLGLWGESITADLPVTADEPGVFWLASIVVSERESPVGQAVTMFLLGKGPSLYANACGSNYPLEHGRQYLVDLSPVDAAGHRGEATAPSLLVEIP